MRYQEQPACARAGRKGHRDDVAAAQVVRQRPEHQQRGQKRKGIDAEDGRQCRRREPPLGLVDPIQRRRGHYRQEQHERDPGDYPEARRTRQRRLARRCPCSPTTRPPAWSPVTSRPVAAGAGVGGVGLELLFRRG